MATDREGTINQTITLGQLLQRNDHHKLELINGIPYMAPDPDEHPNEVIADGIYAQLMSASAQGGWAALPRKTAIRLVRGDESDESVGTMVKPDAALVCTPSRIDRWGLRGAPDWVAEVVSPASAIRDHMIKRQVYEQAGVQEYWLVQPLDSLLTVYRLTGRGYDKPEFHELIGQSELNVLPGVYVDWARILEPSGGCDD